jgi:hypothetical protein
MDGLQIGIFETEIAHILCSVTQLLLSRNVPATTYLHYVPVCSGHLTSFYFHLASDVLIYLQIIYYYLSLYSSYGIFDHPDLSFNEK